MSFDTLPAELRLKIVKHVDILDIFSLVRVSRSWRLFIERQTPKLPKFEISSLRVEQFDYVRFKFRAHLVNVQPKKKTKLKYYYFRTNNDLWLFLQFLRVNKSVYLQLFSDIEELREAICTACKDVEAVTFRVLSSGNCDPKVSADYLARICEGLPKLKNLSIEDASKTWDEDAFPIIAKLKKPVFIEARSGKSRSLLRIHDNTLKHLVSLGIPLDVIVLSTERSRFSLGAVRHFLENAEFVENGVSLLELYTVECSINDFFNLLSDMRIEFESEPMRGIYNSFPITLKGKSVCINIKHFGDAGQVDDA